MTKGPVPPPLPPDPAPGSSSSPRRRTTGCWRNAQRRFPGGTMRLVSERQFPISTTVTGALLRIKAGGLRELHWHPNADEWQYYVRGRGRMTVFGSHGRARTDEFAAGDVGYVPQGYGHYIENIGSEELEVVIVLNNGSYKYDFGHGLDGRYAGPGAGHQFQGAGAHLRGLPQARNNHAGVNARSGETSSHYRFFFFAKIAFQLSL